MPHLSSDTPTAESASAVAAAQAAQAAAEYAAESLKESERQYRRLFEAARDGILLLDSEQGKVTDANPFMTEMLGYSHDELLGKELWQIGLLQDKAASQEAFQRLKREGYIRYEDLPLETRRGEKRQVEFVSNLYREDGDMAIQCNIRDITERKRVEAELAAADIWVAEHKAQAAVLEERTRIARDIHDTLAQDFAGIVNQLDAAESALTNIPQPVPLENFSPHQAQIHQVQWEKVQTRIGKARALAHESFVEARQSVAALRSAPAGAVPEALEPPPSSEALARFLTQQVQGTESRSRYVLEGIPAALPPNTAHCLLRVGQEAIANALAHAQASEIDVELSFDTGKVRLCVRDDGRGFDPQLLKAGRFGIIGMRERAEQAGGRLGLRSRLGEGTEVELILPIFADPAAGKASVP